MITSSDFTHTVFNFPSGEMHVQMDRGPIVDDVSMEFTFTKNEDLIELLMVASVLKQLGRTIGFLQVNFMPFARQDRVTDPVGCFSLKVSADIINSVGARRVLLADPHSDVSPALVNNCTVKTQASVFEWTLNQRASNTHNPWWLICPDGGARKKIEQLAKLTRPVGVIECGKRRDTATGAITGTTVFHDSLMGYDAVIVDDICDGGRTFIEIAKVLRTKECGKIVLCVSHGLFTKGLSVFDGLIDEIYTKEERVK